MPPRIELEHQRDFTGGLNLASDLYNLADNETFDCQNVDFDRRGGFALRRGSKAFITTATGLPGDGNADSGYTYVDTSLVRHILAARGGHVKRWDGAAWQNVLVLASSGRTIFAEMNDKLYILPPQRVVPSTWIGVGLATALTTAVGNYNDDLTAPNAGNFPPCKTMAVHHEVMWAANVSEAAGAVHASRVRWSHIAQPEDWRTNDFIDIDKDDENGEIRALVPFGDRLLVFKDKAIYAIHGYPPAGFSVQNLTKEIGAPGQYAVTATEDKVYFWDIDKGAWSYDGKKFEWIFQPLFPLIDDGKINMPFSNQVICQFHNDRLWLSVPFLAAPYANKFVTLVYAPTAGIGTKGNHVGAWSIHTKTLFGWWVHRGSAGGDLHLLGGDNVASGGYLMELDVSDLYTDQNGVSAPFRIDAWYTTRWFDADNPAVKKRWKRPIVIMRGGVSQRTICEVLTDYDPTAPTKSFDLVTTLDGSEGVWDVSDWDEVVWAAEVLIGGEKSVILRGQPLSGGVAKALRFKNTTIGQDWRVHSLTMKWIPRRIRN